jgi:hypothetical protein
MDMLHAADADLPGLDEEAPPWVDVPRYDQTDYWSGGSEESYLSPPAELGMSPTSLREKAELVLERADKLCRKANAKAVDVIERTRWNSHYPVMCTAQMSLRPFRPSIINAAARGVRYLCVVNRFESLAKACENNTRRFCPSLRKNIMSALSNVPFVHVPRGHSHPEAARERTSVNLHIQEVMLSNGLTPYVVSAGPRDTYRDASGTQVHGCRMPYFAKDLTVKNFMDEVGPEDAFVFVDVDYYTHMPTWLRFGRVCILYTFVPEDAAGAVPDGVYEMFEGVYKDRAGQADHTGTMVRLQVAGGEVYEHPLWDYSRSHVTVDDWWGNRIVFLVETRRCPSGRRIVCFFPESVTAWPYGRAVAPEPLTRLCATHRGIPVLELPTERKVSVGCPGTMRSVRLSTLDYMSWVQKFNKSKTRPVGDVEKWMRGSEDSDTKAAAQSWHAIVYMLLEMGWSPMHAEGLGRLIETGDLKFHEVPRYCDADIETYVLDRQDGQEDGVGLDGNPMAQCVAPPLVTLPTPVPAKCRANAYMAVQLRVKNTQEKFKGHVVPVDCRGYAGEFVRSVLANTRGRAAPIDLDALADIWTRPTQRQNLASLPSWNAPEPDIDRGFMKAETGAKPRQIVNKSVEHNAPLGCYIHPIMDLLKKEFRWVGCGLDPVSLGMRVSEVTRGTEIPFSVRARFGITGALQTTHEGDITNCDGSQLRWHRDHLIDPILIGISAPEYRGDLRDRLKEERAGKQVFMAEGHHYICGDELTSGTSMTTIANILKVAFGDYVALRRIGLTVSEALACLGVYCGDDSLMVALPDPTLAEARVRALFDLGMDQKMIVRNFPDPPTFLGSFHYGAWVDEPMDVMIDFWRTVQKLHVSCNRSVSPLQALANKVAGLSAGPALSDPLLGPWLDRMDELLERQGVRARLATMTSDESYRVKTDMRLDYVAGAQERRLRLRAEWSMVTGVDQGDLDEILAQIDRAQSIDEMPRGVLDNVLVAKKLLPGVTNHGTVVSDVSPPATDKPSDVKQQQSPRAPKGAGSDRRRAAPARRQGNPRRKAEESQGDTGNRRPPPDPDGWKPVAPRRGNAVQRGRGRGQGARRG